MKIRMLKRTTMRPKKMGIAARTLIHLIIIGSIAFAGCDNQTSGTAGNGGTKFIPSVEAVQVRFGSLPLTERLTGVVKAKNQVEIYPQINAVITDIYVRDGDIVKKGDPLLELRDKEFQEQVKQAKASHQIASAQMKQAEAQLNKLTLELKRTETLAEKGLSSDAELEDISTKAISAEADLDLAKARVAQAQAIIEEREENLSRTIVRAPVSGSIGSRNAEIGMRVNTNTRLFTLGELSDLKIEIILTDKMLNYIKVGQRSEINADNLSKAVEGKLSRISPFLNPITHSTEAEIDIKNPEGRLNPGMFVTTDIFYGESESATLIPLSAMYDNPANGAKGVYVSKDSLKLEIDSGTSSENPIKLSGPVYFEFIPIEIIAEGRMQAGIRGVKPGQWVITLGQNLMGADTGLARVNTISWDRVEELQNLQSQDLLKEVMDKQHQENKSTNDGTGK